MKRFLFSLLAFTGTLLLPSLAHAQVSQGVDKLHDVLDQVYHDMIPMCSDLLEVCQAIAGLGVIFYIGVRVWKHIARAEAIDFFPLFRPFVIVLLISRFTDVLAVINGVLDPSVKATAQLVQHSNDAVNTLLLAEAAQVGVDTTSVLMTPNEGYKEGWDKYAQPNSTTSDSDSGGGFWSAIGAGFKFIAGGMMSAFRFLFRFLLSIVLEVLYFAASLCIDTVRIFHLTVLAILGPFAFAFSCYDGFHQSLTHWLGRYINIYLWLPIANLLGAILGRVQEKMLQIDLTNMQDGALSFFSPTDLAYLIFCLIGVVAYTTVPSLANYIIHVHGPNPVAQKVSQLAGMAVTAATGGAAGGAGAAGAAGASASGGGASAAGAASVAQAQASSPNQYSRDKIAG